MSARIIDGKSIAKALREEMAREIAGLKSSRGITPGLHAILVGDDSASQVYVRNKERACVEIGMAPTVHRLPATTSEATLLGLLRELNADPSVHGILVQLPLPKHIDEKTVTHAIDPRKDADGFHPVNVGNLVIGRPAPAPCTPAGVIELLDRTKIPIASARAVVVGRSNIVGKPVALMLLARHATVTICHSRTSELPSHVRAADIVIAAVGRAKMIEGAWIKPGAAVIDVGMNRDAAGALCGDVDFDTAVHVAGAITPVPGGVGPMTIALLLKNTLALARGEYA